MYTKHPLTQNIIAPTSDAAAWPRPGTPENPTFPFLAVPGRPATVTAYTPNGEAIPSHLPVAEIHIVNSDGNTSRYLTMYGTADVIFIGDTPAVVKKLPTPGYSIGLDIHGYADQATSSE